MARSNLMLREKRGLTPIIATVLLVAVVITLASIVFVWALGFVKEGVEKNGEPIERVCDDVRFEAGIVMDGSDYVLEVNNRADVPIYGFNLRLVGQGTVRVQETLPGTLGSGQSTRITLSEEEFPEFYDGASNQLIVIPILVGEESSGIEKQYTCPDSTGFGVELS